MQPWERRLQDLSQLLLNCGETYFSPDLFRRNTNQFLQTSRTVTFIIQKGKAKIPNFYAWYKSNVLEPWATDPVMSWAKDARNIIEKEGDLEMQSTLNASIFYSYNSDQDINLEISRGDCLKAGVDLLLKAARRQLPPGIADAAVLKIQRRWVVDTLPNHELIYALTYTYAQLHRVCAMLAAHLNFDLHPSIPDPTLLDPSTNDVAKVRFFRLSKPGVGQHKNLRIDADPTYQPPPAFVGLQSEISATPKPKSLADVMAMRIKMAKLTFEHFGQHVPVLSLYDKNWNQIDLMVTDFSDQSEKYMFWRTAADRAFYLKAFAMVWTCEAWVRGMKDHQFRPISELPILSEQLHVVGADAAGTHEVMSWNIARSGSEVAPVLNLSKPEEVYREAAHINFIKPIVEAMKMAHAQNIGSHSRG